MLISEAILQQILVTLEALKTGVASPKAGQAALEQRVEAAQLRNAERHAELVGHMRRAEAKVDRLDLRVDRLHDDMADVKSRLHFVETTVGNLTIHLVSQPARLDKFQAQLALIEKQLDFQKPPSAA